MPRHHLEAMAWLLGLALFGAYGASAYWSSVTRDKGIAELEPPRYERLIIREAAAPAPRLVGSVPDSAVDMSTWAPKRIKAYRDAYRDEGLREIAPEAILRIPAVDLIVPVFADATEDNLNRGAGRIEGTSPFGERGNSGIAAHRDGFFRALRHVREGDIIYLELPHSTHSYKVVGTRIVAPAQTSVLRHSPEPMLTLVTCYPFYFVGPAPKRFIVHARRIRATRARF